MSEIFEVDPAAPDTVAVQAAVAALGAGELVVLPTETVYGIAARPDNATATARIFDAKRRPSDLSLPVLAESSAQAWTLAATSEVAEALARRFWPGALTMVLPRTDLSRTWALGRQGASVAVRVPDHPLSLLLLREAGPLAVTSANLSGHPPQSDGVGLERTFGRAVAVYLVLSSETTGPSGVASTLIDLTGERPRLLRRGGVGVETINATLGANGPIADG